MNIKFYNFEKCKREVYFHKDIIHLVDINYFIIINKNKIEGIYDNKNSIVFANISILDLLNDSVEINLGFEEYLNRRKMLKGRKRILKNKIKFLYSVESSPYHQLCSSCSGLGYIQDRYFGSVRCSSCKGKTTIVDDLIGEVV